MIVGAGRSRWCPAMRVGRTVLWADAGCEWSLRVAMVVGRHGRRGRDDLFPGIFESLWRRLAIVLAGKQGPEGEAVHLVDCLQAFQVESCVARVLEILPAVADIGSLAVEARELLGQQRRRVRVAALVVVGILLSWAWSQTLTRSCNECGSRGQLDMAQGRRIGLRPLKLVNVGASLHLPVGRRHV